MPFKTKRVYAGISKVENQPDGTLKVYGYASSGAVDSDDETITPEAMKAALPDYMKFGAVREMHQPSAAGTALSANVDKDGRTEFAAHIVDPTACLKVTTGVYKGFSIGGKVTERDTLNKSVIKGLKLVEVSLVDRPANPEALLTMWKAERTPEDDVSELAQILDDGTVTPAQVLALVKAAQSGEATATGAAPGAGVDAASTQPADTSVKTAENTDIRKGMYGVAQFAELLQSICWLAEDAGWEAEYEGDNSPIPQQLREWLAQGATIFNTMAAEESAELMARLSALPQVIAMSATATLHKAGAKFSKVTKAQLASVHDAMKSACDALDKLGYMDEPAEDEAAEEPTDEPAKVTKTDDTNGIALTDEIINKAVAPLNEELSKLRKANDDLIAQVQELGKRAAPGRALLKAVSITKGEDSAAPTSVREPETLAPEGTVERATQEMRKIFKSGGTAAMA